MTPSACRAADTRPGAPAAFRHKPAKKAHCPSAPCGGPEMPDKNVKGKCARVAHFADFAVLSESSQVSTSDLSRKAQTVPRLSHGVTIRYTKFHPFGKHNTVGESDKHHFPAKTPVRAKPDRLTPVALRAKRPLIAPSRPSSSRLPCAPVSPASPVGCAHGHVADVPGVQGRLEAWKFRGLEAWLSRWGSAPHPYNSSVARLPGALFSVAVEGLRFRRCTFCSPFSGAALAAPPLPGRGAAPHSQSANLLCVLCAPLCSL